MCEQLNRRQILVDALNEFIKQANTENLEELFVAMGLNPDEIIKAYTKNEEPK